MASNSSFIHAVYAYLIPFLCFISAYITRLQKLGFSTKKEDKDMIFLGQEREGEKKTELHFKFKFPSFENGSGNLFNSEIINKIEFVSDNDAFLGQKLLEFQEKNKVEDEFLDFSSDKNSDGFLHDGDFGEDLGISVKKESNNSVELSSDFLSEKDFNDSQKSKLKEDDDASAMESNKLESLWEHQELIEQLQMELRKAKETGLPTIFEESESPKIIDDVKPWKIDDDVKPWKIDEKVEREDYMGELYKSYSEMMRKLDIFNYQKMYAMGFLQLKESFHSPSQPKPSPTTFKSLVSQSRFKHKRHGSDPIKKFVDELQDDHEVVYVGQTCLSWEFLHWQYEKALDLWNSDPNGARRYNEVAGEFQQFQVLVQRFVENEPFQGPRIQSYVKNRCVLRNLLQVPVIREDCLEDEKDMTQEVDKHVITSEMLVEMVEESIQIFWQFVRTDKYCSTLSINRCKKMPNPNDQKLLQEVRKTLQKSEKKFKDILRGEKCILRKFRQSREDDYDQTLQIFAQVDVTLVFRVLNMSKISRDQLIWCQNKLSKISFFNRKIHRQPAFLLFPS